jgi:ATP-dependent helicase/nuclease subunit A
MFEIAKYVIGKYTEHKKRLVCLDYDDLIYYTKELLTNNAVKDWVLYKLDGGIMHLLVDEAQDTSPKQWQIIEAIMSEFYSGESATKEDRTIFIVGDEKQSIYSFQGADVTNFARVNHFIKDQMTKAKKQYKDIELELAYRSTLPILQFVTEIFGSKYFPKSSLECYRTKAPGLVELWPLYKEENTISDLFWPLVHEFETEQSASSILASDIAKFIRNYIDSGTILPSTGKGARPEDFMILIRRRNQFTHEIISNLKEQQVFVAGIDRMMIMQHLSSKDIIAIAKFALLPEDNLNLAALLRSPIIGMDDLALHRISSAPRAASLYSSIENKDILQQLNYFREIANSLGAFNFLHHIIDIIGYREVLRRHNGEGSDDVLDELLTLASSWGNKNNDNLQEFIYWIEKREIEIKRDVSSSSSVRIMTVHAAKGLEAPIVILADTTSMPKGQSNFLWKNGDFLWLGSSQNSNIFYGNYKSEIESKDYEEYLRLLYVAMTRAEDHLVIVGFTTQEKENENSWYGLASSAMHRLEFQEKDRVKYFGELLVKEVGVIPAKAVLQTTSPWIPVFTTPLPTRNDKDFSYVKSPLASRMDISYGSIIHKILEDSVKTRNFTFEPSHPYVQALPAKLKEPVISKLSKLFLMEKFLNLTQYKNIRTEVSIGYMENDATKIGRIDLLAISNDEVIILDYKTDSHPPTSSDEVNDKYKTQLKFYADSMKKIMPNHKIKAQILWLENLKFMDIH